MAAECDGPNRVRLDKTKVHTTTLDDGTEIRREWLPHKIVWLRTVSKDGQIIDENYYEDGLIDYPHKGDRIEDKPVESEV